MLWRLLAHLCLSDGSDDSPLHEDGLELEKPSVTPERVPRDTTYSKEKEPL